jgi:UDP-xylose:glucoside alpha-1,3-xylosyltransferase
MKTKTNNQVLDDSSIYFQTNTNLSAFENEEKKNEILITSAVCGVDRMNETIVMIKSAIYFSNVRLKFIIFADEIAKKPLRDALKQKIKKKALSHHSFEIRPMQFPNEGIDWKNIFKPCTCQRLFLPVSID